MSLNEGARIVPEDVATEYIKAHPKVRSNVILPNDYGRVQLLTLDALKALVFAGHDRSYITYGELSPDFPLCLDFADICQGDVKREAIKQGIAVRPMFGQILFTRNHPPRHAINYAVLADGSLVFYEPQNDTWMDEPKDLKTLDEFKL